MMAPGTSSMLRARRRDVNVKPNRRLDRKSSRGMLYENEELRLRTININAEVERGQNDIKKLRRENEQLRREIWGLREEYDRLEGLLGKAKRRSGNEDDSENEECCEEEEDLEYDEEEDDDDEADLENAENQQKASSSSSTSTPRSRRNSVRVVFDGLSVVDEETDEEATCDSTGSKHKHEQQFFGKIKLPNGKEGVYMSDAMVPNSNGVQICAWPQQSHYNYTFTPVDSAPKTAAVQENDGFFGSAPTNEFFQRRGGPDLFISGAYPVTTSPTAFPVGGNLDQLLKQMNGNDHESVSTVQIPKAQPAAEDAQKEDSNNVQEIIDALEVQLDDDLQEAVKGVRVMNGNCFVCLGKEESVDALLKTGLCIRGENLPLEDVTRQSVLVEASGVPHDLTDETLARALAPHASVIGDMERKLYKGVDTGERVFKLKPLGTDIPNSIDVEGSRIQLQILKATESKDAGDSNVQQNVPSKPLDNSFAADRFRSQISVRLKQPNPKGNRSLDNIFESTTPNNIHNTSLPIINAFNSAFDQDTKPTTVEKCNRSEDSACAQPGNQRKDPPNIFSKLPIRKLGPNTQLPNTTEGSTESLDVFPQQASHFQSNPFVGGFQMSTPVSQTSANPFLTSSNSNPQTLQLYPTSADQQRHLFLPSGTSNVRVCSPYPHMNTPYASQGPSSGVSSPLITPQNSPQVNGPSNIHVDSSNYLSNPGISGNVPSPGFFLPVSYMSGDTVPQSSNIPVTNAALSVPQSQPSSSQPQGIAAPSPTQNTHREGNKQNEDAEGKLTVPKSQPTSVPSSPVTGRRQKHGILSHQHSKSSGDEGPRASPGLARRKISRKVSGTSSIGSQDNLDASEGPNATSSPNTKHKAASHSRKISGGGSSAAEGSGSSHTNVVDGNRSSSSGQDSPTKPDRRRRVSIYFNNKKGANKRRDSVFVANGGNTTTSGILMRSISLDNSHRYGGSTTDVAAGHSAGAETTTTCSERERTNSASSRTSSATGAGRLRKHSECSNRGGSMNDPGKVPWCGCWGNGCL